mmetsp:Transcript_10872/g.44512  ORF Transcript_10872/g.44512 Transcript_10872/m.44512 type:complete len:124 (+) Transcript_10872:156-527(+)
MPRKAKPTKHTAKELKMKADAALTNRGGGQAGMAQRNDAKLGYMCPSCKTAAPSAKSMLTHVQNKHSKFTPPGGNNQASWDAYVENECKASTPVSTGAAARGASSSDYARPGTREAKEKKRKG